MTGALTFLGYSVVLFTTLLIIFFVEDVLQRKLFLTKVRAALDRLLEKVRLRFFGKKGKVGGGFFRLILHYAMHTVLAGLLHVVQRFEARIEELVRSNRRIAKRIASQKQSRNHLDEIADYKNEVALSEEEKRELRSH